MFKFQLPFYSILSMQLSVIFSDIVCFYGLYFSKKLKFNINSECNGQRLWVNIIIDSCIIGFRQIIFFYYFRV